MATNTCYSSRDISTLGGLINQNQDGTISVYIPNNEGVLSPLILTKSCCLALNPNYTFDVINQKCYWTNTSVCDIQNTFKVILNPQGNDGTILDFGNKTNCVLDVQFDYLFKIKCETLNTLLINGVNSEYSEIDPQLATQISVLQFLIDQTSVECQTFNFQISSITEEISNTQYSVTCDLSIVTDTTQPSQDKLQSFGKTGFGSSFDLSTSPSSQSRIPSGVIPNGGSSITYCIQEPDGLLAWSNILGPVNYQNFLNGDPNSYTCENVQELIALNSAALVGGNQPLIIQCTTLFGTKTELINQLNVLQSNQLSCQSKLETLNNQLIALQDTFNSELTNSCIRPIDMFESLDISMIVEVLSGSTYETVYEGTDFFPSIGFGLLYPYLTSNDNSGFYVCGGEECTPMYLNTQGVPQTNTTTCESVVSSLLSSLYSESNLSGTTDGYNSFTNSISNSAFTSSWLHYQTTIDDLSILNLMNDRKIRIGFKINHTCADICILLDNIQMNKVCTDIKETKLFVTTSPGFTLDKIRDNKKSWLKNNTLVNRDFEILNSKSTNPIRQTNYNVEDERLVINSKEIDLDISLASAIVTDVWCYLLDNQCLLSGTSYCDPCFDYKQFEDGSYFEFSNDIPYEFQDSYGISNFPFLENCYIIETTSATTYGTFLTAYTGSVAAGYDQLGTNFYHNTLTGNLPYTLHTSGLSDNSNIVITADTNVSGNNLWDSNGSPLNGRLNNCGIWCTPGAPLNNPPFNEWIGFSKCITLETDGVYTIGVAADNRVRFKINSELFYVADIFDTSTFVYWRVFEVNLKAGPNIIELEGKNDNSKASFGAEIYRANIATLSAMTTTAELDAVTVFSTKDFRYETNGNNPVVFDLGESSGYSCPSGYFLDTCSGDAPYSCGRFVEVECPVPLQCCGDNQINFEDLLTQPLTAITVVEDFEYYLTTELIDVKNRKTISSYPTLRALYDRYMDSYQYCGVDSSEFDYQKMNQFAGLVGDYWVDIIEQVVPSTTIWGSVKIFSNTIFDQQKFKYRSYSSLLCNNPFDGILVPSPISGTSGQYHMVDVNTVTLSLPTSGNSNVTISNPTNCDRIYIAQMNSGSEFIGTVNIVGGALCDNSVVVSECSLQANVVVSGLTVSALLNGASYPVYYNWSNGDSASTTSYPTYGIYNLIVTDSDCCSVSVDFEIPPPLVACWYTLPDTVDWIQRGFNTYGITDYVYTMNSMIVNGVEMVTGIPPTYDLTDANLDVLTTPSGLSYTNFVTFLNQAFNSLGLNHYKAQLSITNAPQNDVSPFITKKYLGFYIIRPIDDTFNMYISETNNADSIYTQDNASDTIGIGYKTAVCNNIEVVNGVVIE